MSVGDINGLADRIEARAKRHLEPELCNDMLTAALLCRHITRVGVTTSLAIA